MLLVSIIYIIKLAEGGGSEPSFSPLIYDYCSKELCTSFYGNEKLAFVWQHIKNHDSFIIQCNSLRLTANYGKLRKNSYSSFSFLSSLMNFWHVIHINCQKSVTVAKFYPKRGKKWPKTAQKRLRWSFLGLEFWFKMTFLSIFIFVSQKMCFITLSDPLLDTQAGQCSSSNRIAPDPSPK